MANYTRSYNLKKPLQTEYYNVDDFNDNADIIDGALNGNDVRLTACENDILDIKDVLKSAAKYVTIAASDSEERYKKYADYICDGVSDEVTIKSAIDSLTSGGIILLCPGNFNMNMLMVMQNNISIYGYNKNTILNIGDTDTGIMLYGDDFALRDIKINFNASSGNVYASAVYFNGTGGMFARRAYFENVYVTSNVLCFCDNLSGDGTSATTGGSKTRFVGVICESDLTSGFSLVHRAAFGAVFDNNVLR